MITTWTTLLLTGLRGNGKTLHAVQLMDEFVNEGTPVFASNFTDLTLPGVQFLEDPNNWRDLPAGSVLFVDEAQRFWRSRRSGDAPKAITDMETQRHDGIRIVLLTQQPTYLDKHLRGLVDVHRHLIRRAGLQASQVFEWERIREEVENPAVREEADKSIWPFPKEYFGTYRSAEVHTVKAKLPMRAKLLLAGIPLIAGLMWFGMGKAKGIGGDEAPTTEPEAPVVSSAAGDESTGRRARKAPVTTASLIESMRPRIPGAEWSAPIYDEANEVQDPPQVYCMIGAEVCRCLTDQGTRYKLPDHQCRAIVWNGGILNPYKPKRQDNTWREASGGEGGSPPSAMDAQASAPSSGTVITAPQVSGYGDIEAGTTTPATENGS